MFKNKKFRMFLLENKLMNFIVSKVIPNLEALIIRINLEEYINKTLKPKSESDFFSPNLNVQQLESLQKKEMERSKIIEDKAKMTIAGITIAISTLSTGIAIYKSIDTSNILQNQFVSLSILLIFIISFSYFVLSGISALTALGLKEVHDIYLDDELELSNKGESFRISRMVKNLRINYSITPQREIYLSASYQSIKNGILSLLVGILLLGGFFLFNEFQTSYNGEKGFKINLIQARVIEVIDPKTLKVSMDGKEFNITLYLLNVPKEDKQFYKVSNAYTEELVLDKKIYIHLITFNKNESIVYLDKSQQMSLNQLLIKNGLAKVINTKSQPIYSKEFLNQLIYEENQAKRNNYGMWLQK